MANTVPLASMIPLDEGLIFMSLIVTFRRTSGLGSGAGKTVSNVRPGKAGVDIDISGDSAERYDLTKKERAGDESDEIGRT